MKKFILAWILMAGLVWWVSGCSDLGDSAPTSQGPPPADSVSFAAQIQPIFDAHCIVCHGAAINGDLDLTTYASLMDSIGPHAPVVLPMNPDSSYLVQKLDGTAQPRMPQGGPYLTDEQIGRIRLWIEQGALDN